MPISLKCHGCRSTLKVRDELAGRKVKCPRCQTVLVVPEGEEVAVGAAAVPARARSGKTGRIQASQPVARRKHGIRTEPGRDFEPAPAPSRGKDGKPAKKYKPCPKCGAEGARRVRWTAWGSFYGPAMFTHVVCPECGAGYNGKTGRSNIVPAIIFVTMPLIGIAGIICAIVYMLVQRGHLKF
jgi:ribosomal protein S27E